MFKAMRAAIPGSVSRRRLPVHFPVLACSGGWLKIEEDWESFSICRSKEQGS